MNTMNDVEVIINNKRYTLSGYESGEYLQKIASYINGKLTEFKVKDKYNKLDVELKNILLEINIADDFFKAQKQVSALEEEMGNKSDEIFEMKHEVIKTQARLEETKKELQALKSEYLEAQKKIIRLETELEERQPDK